jgi:hypothetical protein
MFKREAPLVELEGRPPPSPLRLFSMGSATLSTLPKLRQLVAFDAYDHWLSESGHILPNSGS